jgi:hypothetical protein
MPSVGEIFTVSGVDVGVGVDVASGKEALDVSKVSEVSEVRDVGAGVEVVVGGVTGPWQAARKKRVRRKGMIFFMGYVTTRRQSLLKVTVAWLLLYLLNQ